jgi:hypothetical protein
MMSEPAGNETIYILDQVTPKPGQAEAFLAAYMEKYAPAARARGMTLVHRWVAPPMWLKEQSNTLFIIWTVQGARAWWQMSFLGRRDPAVSGFWEEIEPMIEKRHRSFLSDVADVESLCHV